jgi:hypothetical protein
MSEAELSRIAREAVHQAPDSRLDKQLERMGLLDASEATGPQVAGSPASGSAPPAGGLAPLATSPAPPTSSPTPIDPELERLRGSLRRSRQIAWALAVLAAILVVAVVVLLQR